MKYILGILLSILISSSAFARSNTDLIQSPTARFDEVGIFSMGAYNTDNITGVYAEYHWGDKTLINFDKLKDSDIDGEDKYSSNINLKYLLNQESKYIPAIALGINSINGNDAYKSEYITLSKKYYNWDFHTGVSWQEWSDEDIFAGLSYKALDELKLKLEYKNDLSIGVDYDISNFTLSANLENIDTLMTRINYSFNTKKLENNYASKVKKVKNNRNKKTNLSADRLVHKASKKNIPAFGASREVNSADLWLEFKEQDNATQNLIDASRVLYNNTDNDIKWLSVVQNKNGLKGDRASILRTDLEKLDNNNGSLDKLIQKAIFTSANNTGPDVLFSNASNDYWFINPALDLDPFQKHNSAIYRAYILAGMRYASYTNSNWVFGFTGRLNLGNNMKREWLVAQGRGMEKDFAEEILFLENMYYRKTLRLSDSFYLDGQFGLLEEMYSGLAIELMYKPSLKNWGVSLTLDEALTRRSPWDIGFATTSSTMPGLHLYYEPDSLENTIIKLSIQKYLANDAGLGISAEKTFNNGLKLKAYGNFSNESDDDITSNESFRINTGVNLSYPIGLGSKHNYAEINVAPLGLITGETLKKPESLYKDLHDISYNNLIKFKR